jgi:hypothetical protein
VIKIQKDKPFLQEQKMQRFILKAIFIFITVAIISHSTAWGAQEHVQRQQQSYKYNDWFDAIQSGDIELAQFYFDAGGISIHKGDERRYNQTALQQAIFTKKPEMVKLILDLGFNFKILSFPPYGHVIHDELIIEKANTTVLELAIRYSLEISELLLSYGADVNEYSYSGYPIFQILDRWGNMYNARDIVAMLVRHSADLNKVGLSDKFSGETILHWAINTGRTEIEEALSDYNALNLYQPSNYEFYSIYEHD